MPDPREDESQKDFVSRCIPIVLEDGTAEDQEQAAAVCYQMYRDAQKSVKAVTKKEGDGEHPASHYLVVEDPEKVTTWHLRVKDKAGKLDHGLMGAAWAALHEGWQGNKYEGPQKQQALAKLKKLYAAEGMDTPGSKAIDADNLISFGEPVKATFTDDGKAIVGSYGILYGSPEQKDIEGEWFAPDTDYGAHRGDGMDTTFNHRIPLRAKQGDPEAAKQLYELSRRTFAPVKATSDEYGIFVEAVLDLSDRYEALIATLAKQGKLRWSSGSAPHMVDHEPETGKLTRWPIIEWAYTPTAAEPRLPPIAPMKALAGLSYPELEEAEAAPGKGDAPESTAGHVTVNVNIKTEGKAEVEAAPSNQTPVEGAKSTEVTTMSENEKPTEQVESVPVDVLGIAQTAAEEAAKVAAQEAVKAFRAELEKEPPVKSAGVLITEGRADRELAEHPYKGVGEFLLDVATVGAHGIIPDRLKPLKSNDPIDESGFSLGKALGTDFVGSLRGSRDWYKSMKAPTGLQETTPALGGFLVGTDQAPGLLARAYAVGNLLQRVSMTRLSAGSNAMTFNAESETSRADGSRRGGIRAYWAAEAGEKTASYPEFRQMELKLRKVVGLCYATDELLADAAALEDWIMDNYPEELRFVVEDAIVNGTGAGQPQGILASGALVSVAKETGQAATTIVAENVMKMWARLWNSSRATAVWLINQDILPQLMQLQLPVGTGGVALYVPPGGLSAAPYGTLLGRPVLESEYCQTLGTQGDILLVDLKQYQMIEKGGVEAASSIHVRFVYDETCFRLVYRCDGESMWNSALTPKNGTNTVSPFVALATRA